MKWPPGFGTSRETIRLPTSRVCTRSTKQFWPSPPSPDTRTQVHLLVPFAPPRLVRSETALQYSTTEYLPVTSSFTGAKAKPVLDRNGFQQLLAAAYVLQQHNESLRTKDPRLATTWIFS